MKSIKYFGFFLVASCASLLFWLFASVPVMSQAEVWLQTNPPLEQIIPASEPVKLTLQALNANKQPLSDANVQIRLLTPPKTPWFTSDFPIVEGTTLLEFQTIAPSGKLQFEQVLPIRGTYRMEINITPQIVGRFRPFEQVLTFSVPENPVKYRNVAILIGILLLAGFGSGWVLGGNQRTQEGEIAPKPVRMLLSAVTLLAIVTLVAINVSAEITEGQTHHHEHGESPSLTSASSLEESQGIQVRLSGDNQATVGQMARQTVQITDTTTRKPITDAKVKLQAVALEHNELMFSFDGLSEQAGQLTWQAQFFDGAPHRVTAIVSPTVNSVRQFSPIQVAHEVEVEGIAPPLYIRFISLLYFTAIFAVSLTVGFVIHRRTKTITS